MPFARRTLRRCALRRSVAGIATLAAALVAPDGTAQIPVDPLAGGARPGRPNPYVVLDPSLIATPPLDAFSICVWGSLPAKLDPVIDAAKDGDLARASETLVSLLGRVEVEPRALRLLRAMLAAREAGPEGTRASGDELAAALADAPTLSAQACGHVERARLDLVSGRYPEAAAHALRATRMIRELPDPSLVAERADFYRAESLYFSGHREQARVTYRSLADSSKPRTVAAARLRLADLRFDEGQPALARDEYETLLVRASAFGASIDGWALRAAEAARADDDLAAAANWVQRFLQTEPDPRSEALATVRLADFFVERGDVEAGRELLVPLRAEAPDEAIEVLVGVRMIDLGIDSSPPDERWERLAKAGRSRSRALSLYARGVHAHALRESERVPEALELLSRLAYDSPSPTLAPHLVDDVDRVLAMAVERNRSRDRCDRLVDWTGKHQSTLVRIASEPAPFLAIGECYAALGLPNAALDVYRSITRSFGTRAGEVLALPVARAALALGDVGLARTAAAAGVRRGGEHADAWRLLQGEAELHEGHWTRAAEGLEPLLASGLAPEERLRATWAFARAAARLSAPEPHRDRLREAVLATADEERDAHPDRFGEAALRAAEIHRELGESARALPLYELAVAHLTSGVLRAEAAYWLGALHPDSRQALVAWRIAVDTEAGGTWSALAADQLETAKLRVRGGREPQVPAKAGGSR